MMHDLTLSMELRAVGNRDDVKAARLASGTPRLRKFVFRAGHVGGNGFMPIATQLGYCRERHVRTERTDDELFASLKAPIALDRNAGVVTSAEPVFDIA